MPADILVEVIKFSTSISACRCRLGDLQCTLLFISMIPLDFQFLYKYIMHG